MINDWTHPELKTEHFSMSFNPTLHGIKNVAGDTGVAIMATPYKMILGAIIVVRLTCNPKSTEK